MSEVCAGTVHAEEVGEAGDGDTQEGSRPITPCLAQRDPVAPRDLHRPEEVGGSEAGGVDQDIGLVSSASGVHDRTLINPIDGAADQIDVRSGQRPKPTAVVLERALACRRVVGDDLGRQFLVTIDLTRDPVGEHLAREVVHLAYGALLIWVVGIDPGRLKALVAAWPEDQESIPPPVEGKMAQCPSHAGADCLVIVRVGEHPLGTSLEDRQVSHLLSDGRGDLEPAGPRPDHRNSLARQVDVMVPTC